MSRRISKRVREEAALLCALRASYFGGSPNGFYVVDYVASECGIGPAALSLAWAALDAIPLARSEYNASECWAEAEAMLRTGWTP